jgi:hypothetical protein
MLWPVGWTAHERPSLARSTLGASCDAVTAASEAGTTPGKPSGSPRSAQTSSAATAGWLYAAGDVNHRAQYAADVARGTAAAKYLEATAPRCVHRVPTDGKSLVEEAAKTIALTGWLT